MASALVEAPPPAPPPSRPGYECVDCHYLWDPTAKIGTHWFRSNEDDQIRCVYKPYCRQRQLRVALDFTGPPNDGRVFYAQVPEPRLRHMADPRPLDWKERGWRPIGTEMQRVDALLLLHSVCFPAFMPYACRLNADGSEVDYFRTNIRGREVGTRDPQILTVGDIALLLNMKHQNVSRALKALEARHLWKRDGVTGAITIVPQPAALTMEERWALVDEENPEESRSPSGELRELPKDIRAQALAILKQAPDDRIRSDARSAFQAVARQYADEAAPVREQLIGIRNRRDLALREVVKTYTIISPRERRLETTTTGETEPEPPATWLPEKLFSGGAEGTAVAAPPAANGHSAANGRTDLWDAGFGDGALAKLPAKEQRAAAAAIIEAAKPYIGHVPDAEWIRGIGKACSARAPDITPAEIAAAIHQVGPSARKKDSPSGWLLTVVPRRLESPGALADLRLATTLNPAQPTLPPCPKCNDAGLLNGATWTNMAELLAIPEPQFCDCSLGESTRWGYESERRAKAQEP